MVKLLSVPMISTGFVSSFFFVFYLYLSLKTKNKDKEHHAYSIFSVLSLVNTVYVISFSVLLNSGDNPPLLFLSNRMTIITSMFVILLNLHFNKYFFDFPGRLDLIIFYIINTCFTVLCLFDTPVFLADAAFPTSQYYTGMKAGILFQAWGTYVIIIMLYSIIVFLKGYFSVARNNKKQARIILFLVIASTTWSTFGILDALTAIQIIDLPPLTWAGSLFIILCIEITIVTKIENLYARITALYEQVIHDSATEVFSRSYFEMELDKRLQNKQLYETYQYLVLVDIDNFKFINDTYGHICGDYVLKRIAEIMKTNLRKPDIIARYGGDEFIILITGEEEIPSMTTIIDRIRKNISKEIFNFLNHTFAVTCSFGIAYLDQESFLKVKVKEDIIAIADSALYKSKQAGKNQVYLQNLQSLYNVST